MSSRSFLERNIAHFTSVLQDSLFAEEAAAKSGWLQSMDPRVKACSFVLLLLAAAFGRSITVLTLIYSLSVILAAGSHVFSFSFFRRVWIFMPLYSLLIALPALFLTPGKQILSFGVITITQQGLRTAGFLVLRVAISVSFLLLLVVTTSWPRLLKALQELHVPKIVLFLIAMTYRYIYVLLHTANSLFLARKSRKVGLERWKSTSQWLGTMLGVLLGKSYQLSSDIYLAMQARGFRGEPATLGEFQLRASDYVWMFFFVLSAALAFYFGYWRMV
jgi:cobalt/nickel transport system permease protein